MVSAEARTEQTNLGQWDNARTDRGLKGKPTRENLTAGQVEAKKESMKLFKKLLMAKPGDNVEIRVYWPGRKGKIEESVALEHDSTKMIKGKRVITEAPNTIEQIVMLSVEKGIPEGISVKTVSRWDTGVLRGEIIIPKSVGGGEAGKDGGSLKESSSISSYSLVDQDYRNVLLRTARRLDTRYINMFLQEIGKDLKVRKINNKNGRKN